MYRDAINELYKWKANSTRKPLIIRGARQVGKTWIMKEFGKAAYAQTVYISFDENRVMRELFSGDLNVSRLVTGIELYAGYKIDPAATLLIFDEIQEAPRALTSLKYWNENAPEYQIICAGSLLGVALHEGTSFPVGKVEFLDLQSLSYTEFLHALDKERFAKLLADRDYEMISVFKDEYIELLKNYYYVGGMPEAVSSFSRKRDYNEVREIQARILAAYEQDFSKHAPNESVPRIRMLWNSIPAQLTKENKKFIYGLIREGARAREYEYALMWLSDCGLVNRVHRVTAPNLPLKAYEDLHTFKLFLSDVGLLSCMVNLQQNVLISGSELFKEFKGALTEQYVLQQLKTIPGIGAYYWANDNRTLEIDFLIDTGNQVIPVEVKAETNLQSKSLKSFAEKFQSQVSIRSSMTNYKKEANLTNLPLYAIGNIVKEL